MMLCLHPGVKILALPFFFSSFSAALLSSIFACFLFLNYRISIDCFI